MKYVIAALLCALTASAQSIDINTINKETGLRSILTKNTDKAAPEQDDSVVRNGTVYFSAGYQEVPAGKGKRGIYFFELNLVHNDARVGCLTQENGKVVLGFEDGTEMECIQISATDCDNVGFVANFMLGTRTSEEADIKANFEKLQRTPLKKIVVHTTEKAIRYNIKTISQPVLSKHFTVVANALTM